MEEILDVFGVVEGCRRSGRFGNTLLGARFARVDALEDAEAAKVGERDLKFADSLRAGEVVLGGARGAYKICMSS